jgi:hypothetical protein
LHVRKDGRFSAGASDRNSEAGRKCRSDDDESAHTPSLDAEPRLPARRIRAARARGRPHARRRAQDLEIDLLGLRRGIGPELVREQDTATLVDAERLSVVAGGRVCPHQQAIRALPKRLDRRDLLGLHDGLARLPRFEVRLGQCFERADEKLMELAALLLHPRPVLAGEERPSCQLHCCLGTLSCFSGVARGQRSSSAIEVLSGRCDVDPDTVGEHELVAAEGAREGSLAVHPALLQERAQLAHEHSQRLLPGRGRCLTPERLGEFAARHGSSVLGKQICEDQAPLAAGKALLIETRAVGLDRDLPGERDPHGPPPYSCRSLPASYQRLTGGSQYRP